MNEPSYDTDAEPIVQLTDAPLHSETSMPVAPTPLYHPHLPTSNGFDKTKLILPASILIAAVLISCSILYARSNAGQNPTAQIAGVQKPVGKVKIDLTNAMILGD